MKRLILFLTITIFFLTLGNIFWTHSNAQNNTVLNTASKNTIEMTNKGELTNKSEKKTESQQIQTEKITNLPSGTMKIINLNDVAAEEEAKGKIKPEQREIPFMKDPLNGQRELPPGIQLPVENQSENESLSSLMIPSPTTTQSFQALGDNGGSIPPDTHGAAGPNHLMTVLNTQVRIQSKTGTTISTVSLNGFWSAVASAGGVFDPKILYDQYAGRWIFTACVDRRSANSGVLLGISQTSDPTGNWFLYRAVADSNGIDWADYPSFGFNKDWVVVSVNMFANTNDAYNGTRIFIFRKSSMYNGTFNAGVFIRSGSEGSTITPAITQSSTEPTMYMLSDWNGFSGLLRLYTITGAVGSELYTATQTFPQSVGLTWQSAGPENFAPQLGNSVGIMNNDDRMQQVVFRNGSLWATHSVVNPTSGTPTNNAVQWWQINPANGGVIQVGRIQESSRFFAFPSIAVNQNNDVLVGYSSFASSQFAAANYSFRAAADAPGTMRDPATLKAGEDCYYKTFSGTRNRWGDYSNTVVDPTDDTSFWTIQEYAAQSSPAGVCTNGSGRWATWWGKISPPSGTCTYSLNPTGLSYSAAAGSGSFQVNTQSGCAWTTTVNAPALPESFLLPQLQEIFPQTNDLTSNHSAETEQVSPSAVFLNSTPITINDRTANTNPPGTASLYPSTITVSGMTGTITQVDASLNNLSHTFPDDVDVILVGPGGQRTILMSDAGGDPDISGVNLTFNQSAATQLPDSTQITTGTYRPTNFNGNSTIEPGGVDNFPSPGPGQNNYTADLSVFNGTSPNGTWQLYVVDDENVDSGNIATGWALGITTSGGGTSWITITSGSTGTGNGTVNYTVAANAGTSQRTGTITVNGQVHTITQSGTSPCTYSMSTNSNNIGQGTGSTNFFMNAPSGCAWSAVSDSPSWLTTSSSGSGNGTISYNYSANTSTSTRIGRITAGGQIHTVTQIGLGGGGSVQFSSTNYSVNENAGTVTITVTRMGGTASGSVQYSTSNGTALAGVDYQSASGTLFFFENETTKTFTVTILDDSIFEGNETINLSLSSASPSFSLGTPSSTVLTIIDNESTPPNNRKPFDFDGDSKTDIGIFRPSNGQWWINRSSNNQTVAVQFGTSSDKLVPADFTGDGKTDVAFWRPSTGEWFIIRSEDNSFYAFPFGSFGDIPAPGDFDGDGRADPAVFRPSNATWYILLSGGGGVAIRQFGVSEDKPVVADYDGDGKSDIAIFRPSVSEWWILRSTAGLRAVQFGQTGDKTVSGDYTGDGKADIAVWRPANGFWYILRSEDSSFFAFPFGLSSDIPTPGDYDGDAKIDAAVFRPSNSTWYLQRSASGFTAIGFGINGDQPIPNAFVR